MNDNSKKKYNAAFDLINRNLTNHAEKVRHQQTSPNALESPLREMYQHSLFESNK